MTTPAPNIPKPIWPKTLWSLWLQGRNDAPPLVRLNLDRWQALNPEYDLKVLDQSDVSALLAAETLPLPDLSSQVLSDIVRARLLRDHGGLWIDAALFPVKPLDAWLGAFLNDAGFFAFERPKPDRLISSWFLVASRDHPLFHELWKEIARFWSKPRQLVRGIPADPMATVSPEVADSSGTYPYFWFHYLFEFVTRTRPEIASQWQRCARSPADAGHQLQFLFDREAHPSDEEIRRAANAAPVQKLNWRTTYPLDVFTTLS